MKGQTQTPPKKARHRNQSQYLASAWITSNDTNIIDEDLYNEPTKQRLESSLEWVRFFDANSSFLKNLMALCNNSPTLRRIIHDKVGMTTGDGFIPYKGLNSSLLTVNAKHREYFVGDEEELTDLNDFISRVNLYDESLVDVLSRISFEYEAFGRSIIIRSRRFFFLLWLIQPMPK